MKRPPKPAPLLRLVVGAGAALALGPACGPDLYITALTKRAARCAGVGKNLAPEVAALLDHAAYGLMNRAARVEDLRRRLALLVERVVERRA